MRIAAIDVGSNSIHMVIVRRHEDGRLEVIDREKEMVRLASGALERPPGTGTAAARGVLAPDRIEAGLACLRKFAKLAERHQVDALVAAATSAVREAENGGDFIALAEERTGVRIDVLPAREEARLIYLAAREAIDLQGRRALFVDIGGGSVELTVGDVRRSYLSESLKLGVIRLTERFLKSDPPTPKEIAELQTFVDQEAGPILAAARRMEFALAIGTSGTIAACAEAAGHRRGGRASGDSSKERIAAVTLDELTALVSELAAVPERDRVKVPGIQARRAGTILAGALLLERILRLSGARAILPCDRALREGLVIDYLEKNRERLALLQEHRSPRERSVFELARRSGFDRAHSLHVMRLARELFDQLRGVHRLKPRDRELLEYAAVLHDVGQSISFSRHHKHSAYLIRNADLQGFEPEEIEVMALLARYHRKGLPRKRHPAFGALSPERRASVRGLGALLRIADALDRSHFQVCAHVAVRVSPGEVRLRVVTVGDAEIELWTAARKGDLFEEAFGRRLRVEAEARPERARRSAAALPPEPSSGNVTTPAISQNRAR
jgi:exopolyphosphatase/guanosine-5'-triphosphate,3'-diphosphate pyrophosphatase